MSDNGSAASLDGDHVAVPIWMGVSVEPGVVPADSKSMAVKVYCLITVLKMT